MKHLFKSLLLLLTILILNSSCESNTEPEASEEQNTSDQKSSDLLLGILKIQENVEVHFLIQKEEDSSLTIINGKERINLDNFQKKNDSVIYTLHVFDADLVVKFTDNGMQGYWRKNYVDNYIVPFKTLQTVTAESTCNTKEVNGKYEMTLKMEDKERKAMVLLETKGDSVYGTVMTRTGDYRYLHGLLKCNKFTLNTFNGESAYHFEGEILTENELKGHFYSGKTRHETWTATKNDTFELEDPTKIGSSKIYEGQVKIEAPNMENQLISLEDPRYKDKPVIIQILGTWCPNCMDEAAFLSSWIKDHPDANISILGMAFELKDDFDYAKKRITTFKNRYNLPYEILFAGKKSKEQVQKYFPFLDNVIAYPTTIYLNKNHRVVKIYTGFSGPASGAYYEAFKSSFDQTVQEMAF